MEDWCLSKGSPPGWSQNPFFFNLYIVANCPFVFNNMKELLVEVIWGLASARWQGI